MSNNDNRDDFRKEDYALKVFSYTREQCPDLKWVTFRYIIDKINPQWSQGLFERRPCVRKLQYISYRDFEVNGQDDHHFFRIGEVYESLTFNGATYTIKGYSGGLKCIGSAYFDRID
jgi:hypothetical protein